MTEDKRSYVSLFIKGKPGFIALNGTQMKDGENVQLRIYETWTTSNFRIILAQVLYSKAKAQELNEQAKNELLYRNQRPASFFGPDLFLLIKEHISGKENTILKSKVLASLYQPVFLLQFVEIQFEPENNEFTPVRSALFCYEDEENIYKALTDEVQKHFIDVTCDHVKQREFKITIIV